MLLLLLREVPQKRLIFDIRVAARKRTAVMMLSSNLGTVLNFRLIQGVLRGKPQGFGVSISTIIPQPSLQVMSEKFV